MSHGDLRRELERAILGAILDTRGGVLPDITAAGLTADHFLEDAHRNLYQLLAKRSDDGQPIDVHTVCRAVAAARDANRYGGVSTVEAMAYRPSAHIDHDTRELIGLYLLQQIRDHGMKCVQSAEQSIPGGRINDYSRVILEHIEAAVGNLGQVPGSQEESAREGAAAFRAALEASRNRTAPRPVSTGIGAVDYLWTPKGASEDFQSGIIGGEVGIVAGRTGEGKSALTESIVINVAKQGHGVAICSADMNGAQTRGRLISKLTYDPAHENRAVPHSMLVSEEAMSGLGPVWLDSALAANDEYEALPIWIDYLASPTARDIQSFGRRMARKFARDGVAMKILVVDFIGKVNGDPRKDRRLQLEDIIKAMKALAVELSCTVLVQAQLNRDAEHSAGGEPSLHNLKESGSIEENADWVFLVWRPGRRDPLKSPSMYTIIAAKNRRGEDGRRVDLEWHGPTGTVFDASPLPVHVEDLGSIRKKRKWGVD